MSKRASLDLNQFKIELPKQRDPLDSIIPMSPSSSQSPISQKTEVFPPRIAASRHEIEAKHERSDVRTDDGTNERAADRKLHRVKVRHAFDVFVDQLRDLQAIQFKAVQRGRRKPTLGKMVQQAIDLYLTGQAKKTKTVTKNDRSSERTDGGTFGQI